MDFSFAGITSSCSVSINAQFPSPKQKLCTLSRCNHQSILWNEQDLQFRSETNYDEKLTATTVTLPDKSRP